MVNYKGIAWNEIRYFYLFRRNSLYFWRVCMEKMWNKIKIVYRLRFVYIISLLIIAIAVISNSNTVLATETEGDGEFASSLDAASETEAIGGGLDVSANETKYRYDIAQSIVELRLIYKNSSGEEYIIKEGNGFFIGHADSQIYIICGRENLNMTEEEKNQLITEFLIEDNTFETDIQFKLNPDVYYEANVLADSEKLGIMILEPSVKLGDVTTLELDEDEYSNQVNDVIKVLSKENEKDSYWEEGVIVDWCTVDGLHYYNHNISIDKYNYGCPIVDEENKVIGINVFSKGTMNYAVQVGDVIDLCQDLSIEYNPVYSVDITELEVMVEEYLNLDLSNYTKDTSDECTRWYNQAELLKECVSRGEIDYSTQGLVDECTVNLSNSMEGLVEKTISKETVLLIVAISCGALFALFLVLTIVMCCKSKKYKKLLEKEKEDKTTAKEALKLSGRITPGDKMNRLSAGMPLNRSLVTTTVDNQFVHSETTVLGLEERASTSDFMGKIQNNAYIIRRRTGEEVLINKNNFVIGKDSDAVDYYITYNVNISRRHAVITQIKGNYYIKDMETTNGTYVNGFRLEKGKETMLQDGAVIVIADEEFEFCK